MDASSGSGDAMMATVDEFTLELAEDRAAAFDTLLFRGRRVADIEARVIETQFRLADRSTLLLLSDDTPYKEKLTIVLLSAGLKALDRLVIGGAYTPGFLAYASPIGPDEVSFCWHDLEQVVKVGRYSRWFGLRAGWLSVRDLESQTSPNVRERAAKQ